MSREREKTKLHISSLENMVDHIADAVSKLELKVYGKLPSQTVVNPRHQTSAMTLRGGKILEPAILKEQKKIRKVNNEKRVNWKLKF